MNYLAIVSFLKRYGAAGLGMVAMFVAIVYFHSHYRCILDTPRQGFEWECAKERMLETLSSYIYNLG